MQLVPSQSWLLPVCSNVMYSEVGRGGRPGEQTNYNVSNIFKLLLCYLRHKYPVYIAMLFLFYASQIIGALFKLNILWYYKDFCVNLVSN